MIQHPETGRQRAERERNEQAATSQVLGTATIPEGQVHLPFNPMTISDDSEVMGTPVPMSSDERLAELTHKALELNERTTGALESIASSLKRIEELVTVGFEESRPKKKARKK